MVSKFAILSLVVAIANAQSSTVASSTASPTPSALTIACPGSNGTIYEGISGAEYVVECDTDHAVLKLPIGLRSLR